MYLHDHRVFAHKPTVLINPERSELVADHIFYAFQVMTRTMQEKGSSEKYFVYHCIKILASVSAIIAQTGQATLFDFPDLAQNMH